MDLKRIALRISNLLQSVRLVKVNRQANVVAHEIAKFSFHSKTGGILLNSVPPCVART